MTIKEINKSKTCNKAVKKLKHEVINKLTKKKLRER